MIRACCRFLCYSIYVYDNIYLIGYEGIGFRVWYGMVWHSTIYVVTYDLRYNLIFAMVYGIVHDLLCEMAYDRIGYDSVWSDNICKLICT